jgi:hypothetical protein
VGVFWVPNVTDPSGEFVAKIKWGDGSCSWGTISGGFCGMFIVKGSHTYAASGTYTLQVIVSQAWSTLLPALALTSQVVAQVPVQLGTPIPDNGLVTALMDGVTKWGWTDSAGRIKLSKINALIDDQSVKNSQAAAAAILKAFILEDPSGNNSAGDYLDLFGRNKKSWDPRTDGLTAADINTLKMILNTPNNPLNARAQELLGYYKDMLIKIRRTRTDLYPPGVSVRDRLWETVVQGYVGDCSFMATTISLLQAHGVEEFLTGGSTGSYGGVPRIVDKGVVNGVRTFDVCFGAVANDPLAGPGPRFPIWVKNVPIPTDAQLALYGSTTDGYLWLPVFEKAYVTEWRRNVPTQRTGALYDVAIDGEPAPNSIEHLTDHKAKWRKIYPIFHLPLNITLEGLIERAVAEHEVIVLGTRDYKWTDPLKQPPPAHAFAVVGYNKRQHTVTVQNPWNNPNQEWGFQKEIPIARLRDWFGLISIEGYENLPPPP